MWRRGRDSPANLEAIYNCANQLRFIAPSDEGSVALCSRASQQETGNSCVYGSQWDSLCDLVPTASPAQPDQTVGIGRFLIGSCQATLFTPDEEVSAVKLLSGLAPRWAERFNGEPFVLPTSEGVPREIPRLILSDRENAWRCEISSGRINFYWRRTRAGVASPTLERFYSDAITLLIDYRAFQNARVGRLAAVVTRYTRMERPGLFLAKHFCHERWHAAPLNRPENLELHAHKRYRLAGQFDVNSWVRNKTGKESPAGGDVRDIVLVEQDINTVTEEEPQVTFDEGQIRRFFTEVVPEFDHILRLYYPETNA